MDWGPWLAVAVGVLCFANSATNQFAYDDVAQVTNNPRIRSLGNTPEIFTSDWWAPQTIEQEIDHRRRDRLYRPLSMFTLALNYAVGGLNPIGYHLVNIALHGISCALLYFFALRLFEDRAIALISSLIFAVHPIHAEAVANVVGRAEVLATVFLLLGLLVLVPRSRRIGVGCGALAGLCFLFALLAKETAICFVPVAALVLYWRTREQPQSQTSANKFHTSWWLIALMAAWPLLVYFPARYFALDQHLIRDEPPADILNAIVRANGVERVWMAFEVLGHYTRLMLVPQKLTSNYGFAILDPDAPNWILVAVGAAVTVVGGWLLLGFANRALWRRQLALCTAVFVASYALISNSVLLIGVAVAERLMYWPSVPLCLLFSVAIVHLWRRHTIPGGAFFQSARLLKFVGVGLMITLALRTVIRNPDWYDTTTLYLADVETYPRGVDLFTGAAKSLANLHQNSDPETYAAAMEQAAGYAGRAIAIMPKHVDGYVVLAHILALQGKREDAIAQARTAVALDARHRGAREILLKLEEGTSEKQIAELRDHVAATPDDVTAQVELGRQLLLGSNAWDAESYLEDLAGKMPENVEVQRMYADALTMVNKPEAAFEQYNRVLTLDNDDWQTHLNLANLAAEFDNKLALHHAEIAYRLRPEVYESIQNYAEALVRAEKYEHALELFSLMRRGLPADNPLQGVLAERMERVRALQAGND